MFETNLKAKLYDLQEQMDRERTINKDLHGRIEELEDEVNKISTIAERRSAMVRDFVKENRELKNQLHQQKVYFHVDARVQMREQMREQIREEVKKEMLDAFERAITPTETRCF
jgi:hypothetical protein